MSSFHLPTSLLQKWTRERIVWNSLLSQMIRKTKNLKYIILTASTDRHKWVWTCDWCCAAFFVQVYLINWPLSVHLNSEAVPVILTAPAPSSSIHPSARAEDRNKEVIFPFPFQRGIYSRQLWWQGFCHWEENSLSRALRSSAAAIVRRAARSVSVVAAAARTSAATVSIVVVVPGGSAWRTSLLCLHLVWCCSWEKGVKSRAENRKHKTFPWVTGCVEFPLRAPQQVFSCFLVSDTRADHESTTE